MLGDARSDLINLLSVPLGTSKANELVVDLETVVRRKAQEGAAAGASEAVTKKIPDILFQVNREVEAKTKPIFIGAVVAGGVGALLALAALFKARKCRRG